MKPVRTHGTGWKPDLPDKRDLIYHESAFYAKEAATPVPQTIDLRGSPHMPPIQDQGQLGSCTAFGTLAAFDFINNQQTGKFMKPSHLFEYYNSRLIEGTAKEDAGAEIRDAIKAAVKYGAVQETAWPYTIAKFATKPAAKDYTAALKHQVVKYLRVINDASKSGVTNIEVSLAAGFPVVFGATLYESFESQKVATDGIVPMPGPNEQVLGGHCQLIVGYDTASQMFLIRNSWGTSWALTGYEWMPYVYLTDTNLCDDFWTIRSVEG
jgi:C1A family cysteine protease